jgi:hypothetical protein
VKILVKGYTTENGKYKPFKDFYFADTAAELLDVRKILEADGVHIDSITDESEKKHYLTEGESVAAGLGGVGLGAVLKRYTKNAHGCNTHDFRHSEKLQTRSERLAKENKIDVAFFGGCETAQIITGSELSKNAKNYRYIGTDRHAFFDGRTVWANVYENEDGEVFATIDQ